MKYFAWGAIIFIAAAIIGAFFVIGSPAHQRMSRFDEQRVNDLQTIQNQVSNYYQIKGALPVSLGDLTGFQDFVIPKDPQSGAMYVYSVQDKKQFQLCADFALSSAEDAAAQKDNWQHAAGHSCFSLSMDARNGLPSFPAPVPVTVKPVS